VPFLLKFLGCNWWLSLKIQSDQKKHLFLLKVYLTLLPFLMSWTKIQKLSWNMTRYLALSLSRLFAETPSLSFISNSRLKMWMDPEELLNFWNWHKTYLNIQLSIKVLCLDYWESLEHKPWQEGVEKQIKKAKKKEDFSKTRFKGSRHRTTMLVC